MFSLRQLIRPSVLGPSLAAAAAVCGLAVWYANVRAPIPESPSIAVGSESPATDVSFRSTTSDEKVLAAEPFALRLTDVPAVADTINWGYRQFAHDNRFPVVSSDGTVAVLFEDEEDFTGAPITTLVAWSKSGKRIASFAIGGVQWNGNEESVLGNANAWLARSTWSALDGEGSSAWDDDHVKQTITFASGAPLVFDADSGQLKRGRRALRAAFGSPGWSDFGGCGSITGIERAFSSDHLIVLVPSRNLGGDSCMGSPSADLATVVALR